MRWGLCEVPPLGPGVMDPESMPGTLASIGIDKMTEGRSRLQFPFGVPAISVIESNSLLRNPTGCGVGPVDWVRMPRSIPFQQHSEN